MKKIKVILIAIILVLLVGCDTAELSAYTYTNDELEQLSADLEPCPFCDCNYVSLRRQGFSNVRAYCNRCEATGPRNRDPYIVVEMWNSVEEEPK